MTNTSKHAKINKSNISEYIERFSAGNSTDAYEFLGCHKTTRGYIFRVWAPNAKSVRVVGDFNNWDTFSAVMNKIDGGIWEIEIPNAGIYDNYKYYIETASGRFVHKSDPYAFHACTRPENASKIYDIDEYK